MRVDPTNHHNASECPYCTHNGQFVMVDMDDLKAMLTVLEAPGDPAQITAALLDRVRRRVRDSERVAS